MRADETSDQVATTDERRVYTVTTETIVVRAIDDLSVVAVTELEEDLDAGAGLVARDDRLLVPISDPGELGDYHPGGVIVALTDG